MKLTLLLLTILLTQTGCVLLIDRPQERSERIETRVERATPVYETYGK